MTRSTPWLLTGIVVLGLLLRVYRIGAQGLWLDEAFSVWMGRNSLPALFTWLIRIDQHPPLYYTLLHYWLWLGDSAATVRMLSALDWDSHRAGDLCLGAPACREYGRVDCGLAPGNFAPFHVRFAQEARMYTLLTLTVGLAMLALVNILCDPRHRPHDEGRQSVDLTRRHEPVVAARDCPDLAWAAYIFFTACALLSHNTAIFFPVATNIFVLGFVGWHHVRQPRSLVTSPSPGHTPSDTNVRFVPPRLSTWLWAQAGVLLLWSPWLMGFVVQSRGVSGRVLDSKPNLADICQHSRSLAEPCTTRSG